MIPKEQKGPVMAAMGDLAGPGKADSALVRSSDPTLSWSQSVATQAYWPEAWANRCEFQVSPERVLWNLPLGLGSFPKYWEGPCLMPTYPEAETECLTLGPGPNKVLTSAPN